jgi:Carboxypeptidase regulatory-like domain/TonB dependent receptor-like, beta-barrel/TonB-dependent Receptor Plug Domain
MHRMTSVAAVALAVWLGTAAAAHAQQGTGELRGKVVDAQNAVLPGVTVVARNEGSGQFREIVSGPDGSFFMSALTPGLYEMTAQLSGFKKYQRGAVRVEVGKTQSIEVQLQVGGIEQEVVVTAESPLVDTTTKQLGGSVQSAELNDVPSVNRNFTSYLSLLPGVTATISTDSFGADSVRVNGQATQNANYMLDGAGNNDNFNNGNGGAQARVPVEAVQEFQLLTSQFDAEFGQSSGGIVNAVSKQGTNKVHGTGFFFDQNQKMTSLDYFAAQQGLSKPEARQLQWGGNVGGPIVKDKLHYFANLERIDQNRARTININARPELNFTDFTHDDVWNWMVRMDHQINANNTWAVRWLRESSPQTNQFVATNLTRAHAEQENDVDWTVVGTINSVIRNTKVNVFKFSYTHEDVFFGNPGYFDDPARWEATPQLLHQTFSDGASTRANRRQDPAYQFDETFAWFVPGKKGDHDLKFGASYQYLPLHQFVADNLNGTFTFGVSDLDFNPANPRTYPDRFSIRVPLESDFYVKGKEFGVFAQDKWKVNSRLTLSLGARYDVELVPTNNEGNFLFTDPSVSPVDKNNISPRFGATWALDDAGTAVIRGGWGLYYQKTAYSNFSNIFSAGAVTNSFTATFPTNAADPGPRNGLFPTDPFLVNGPVVNRALLASRFPSSATQKNSGVVFFDNPDRHLPYARQASVGFEKQLAKSIAVSADYVHLNHRDLYMLQDINPGQRATTAATSPLTRINVNNAGFLQDVRELVNVGWADYDGLQMSLQKRQSGLYGFRVSYTYSRGYGIVSAPGATDIITSATVDPITKVTSLNLQNREGLTQQDRPHLLSMNAQLQVPHTGGMNVSGVLQYNSGTPFTLTDSTTDPNRNGNFEDPLPAGTYSGLASNVNAITVENKGGINGARGPDYFLINMRAAYRFKLPGNKTLQAHVDVFNVTNHANFNTPSSDRQAPASFLILRSILNGGPTRTLQLNFQYRF